jgi:ABC-type multidrug transport system ATPase subunit
LWSSTLGKCIRRLAACSSKGAPDLGWVRFFVQISREDPQDPQTRKDFVLELLNLNFCIGPDDSRVHLLRDVSLSVAQRGQLIAVLGPSGCGKSTLMKVIAGLSEASDGAVRWKGRNLAEDGDFEPHEVGYVPQFSIAHEHLEVWECIEDAVRMRCGGLGAAEVEERVEAVLDETGMLEIAEKRVAVLSGGQRRRLALGLELVSAPDLLLCDEVTSGLDPKAEDEITGLLRSAADRGRIVLNITHSLKHLSVHDSVVVLCQGRLVFHSSAQYLMHYFGIEHQEDLYPKLATRSPEDWAQSWGKHRASYAVLEGGHSSPEADAGGGAPGADGTVPQIREAGILVQWNVLWGRRWKLFWRDKGQVKLHLALLLGFPCLVVVFALHGLPALRAAAELPEDPLKQLVSDFSTKLEYLRVGGMVSGLIMFQVVLLTLMGANNAAREVAAERLILDKEKFSGLSPLAYVLSKVSFLAVLVVAQSVWMSLFVNAVVRMPGSLLEQTFLLVLVNGAMTAVSLGISSMMGTAEQSSLVSVYLVGFQLPLSGAVLALPEWLGQFTRPFIASYWGWSGFLQTLSDTRFYNAVLQMTQTPLMPLWSVVVVLFMHIGLGVAAAYVGCKSSRWT